jgi:hypothetical protein
MFRTQIQRVLGNTLPFIFIGMFVGLFIRNATWFRSIGWFNDWLVYTRINTRYFDSGQMLFMRGFNPDSLTYMLVCLCFFSALHRIVFGSHGRHSRWDFNQSIEQLGSFLAIAWLGLIVGITVPALIYQSIQSGVSFLTNAVYPLLFLVEVTLINGLLYRSSLLVFLSQNRIYHKLKNVIRLDGLIALALGILMLTYQNKYDSLLYSFTRWVRSLFS